MQNNCTYLFQIYREKILQRIHPGFAYELLSLEIQLDLQESLSSQSKIQSISRVIQLYMGGMLLFDNQAVQALQSKCDKRYKYFSNKIQNLMKKKHVVEELHIASTGKAADKTALTEVIKAQIGQRKNQLDLQLFLTKEQFDAKKIRQIVKTADNKLKTFQKNIETNIKKQDQALQQRKRLRKLKSDAGSVAKMNIDRNFQSPNMKFIAKSPKQMDDYFAIAIDKRQPNKKRTASIDKKEKQLPKSSQINKVGRNYIM